MTRHLAEKLVSRMGQAGIPCGNSDITDHPNPLYRNKRSVEVSFVVEHRFAFYYWIKFKQELQRRQQLDDKTFVPPDLVTWDWHDDCGADADVVVEELKVLNQSNTAEVALYCWAGLNAMNDGQILPAVWLNSIGNVYIIQKQRQNCLELNRVFNDWSGREHKIYYFRTPKHFPKVFDKTNGGRGVIWDVDLDYFTSGRTVDDQLYSRALSGEQINEILSGKNPWMQPILENLAAVTVALEPTYTGGLSVSLDLFRHWEDALFSAPLFSRDCRWKRDLIR